MEAFSSVCGLLIVTTALIQFGRNESQKYPHFGRTGVSKESEIVPPYKTLTIIIACQ